MRSQQPVAARASYPLFRCSNPRGSAHHGLMSLTIDSPDRTQEKTRFETWASCRSKGETVTLSDLSSEIVALDGSDQEIDLPA